MGQDVRQLAREAYTYGFPLVVNYATLFKQAVDTTDRDYRAPFNVIGRTTGVATPDDKFVVTPNSDTPYSFLWADLRAEPVVITVPTIDKGRYYTGQMIDLYIRSTSRTSGPVRTATMVVRSCWQARAGMARGRRGSRR